jgi:hypothetical protein
MWLQIVGKLRLALAPMEPQWAQVPLQVTARGLNTGPIPHPNTVFDVDVDFVDHVLTVRTTAGAVERVRLEPKSVADFYAELMAALRRADVPVEITTTPTEVANRTPYPEDVEHASYEPDWANGFWHALVSVDAVLKEHRAGFSGRTSPVTLWWGSLDLSYLRFSGRAVDPPEDADAIMRGAHDAEQMCAGFWPGDDTVREPILFAYTWPKPDGIEAVPGWNADLGEFVLPYEAVRTASDPRATVLDFLETAYQAGAGRAAWPPELA